MRRLTEIASSSFFKIQSFVNYFYPDPLIDFSEVNYQHFFRVFFFI